MLTLNKLIGCVTLVAGGATGVAVICSMQSNTKLIDSKTKEVVKDVKVKYVSEKGGRIGIKSFTIGEPAPEVRRSQ